MADVTLNAHSAPSNESAVGNSEVSESVRALDWVRCVHINAESVQCDKFFRVTPSCQHFCSFHDPKKPSDLVETDAKTRYIDIMNLTREECYKMDYDALECHIAHLHDQLEVLRTKLFTSEAVRGEKLEKMDEGERQKRRRVRVVLNSALPKDKPGASSGGDTAKATAINDIIKTHKKSAAEALAIYNLTKSNKISVEQAIMLLED